MLDQSDKIQICVADEINTGMVVLLGMPFDQNSTFLHGAHLAPRRIREVLHAGATNLCAEDGIDLSLREDFCDLGDMKITDNTLWLEEITALVAQLLAQGARVLTLGGDHAVTYPIIKAYHKSYANLNILQLDAHPDLYDVYDGNRHSHACPFARIMENKLAARLVQVGVRTLNPHQRQQAERFGVEIIEMRHCKSDINLEFEGPLYLSIDLDVLDPAFAPGISHQEPGGMTTRQLIELIQKIKTPIVGADIVEYNPKRDQSEITAMVAGKLMKEIAGRMIAQKEALR
jgi:agmatinase